MALNDENCFFPIKFRPFSTELPKIFPRELTHAGVTSSVT